MTGKSFDLYVTRVSVPILQVRDLVLLDNLNAQTSETAHHAIEARGVRMELLSSHSPDLNSIEKGWAKVKTVLARPKARTVSELVEALNVAFQSIIPEGMCVWFAHCCYVEP